MNLFPKHILLNGKKRETAGLIHDFREKESKIKLADFLKEWYNNRDFIEVQTSGSTGPPKNIRLKKSFVADSALRTLSFFNLEKQDRILHCLPLDFIAGKLMIVRALIGNLDLFITEPETDFSFLKKEKFSFAAMVPLQLRKIMDNKPFPEAWTQNIGQILIGGSAIPPNLEKQLKQISTPCFSGYAMTETATHIALRRLNGEMASEFYACLDKIRVAVSENGCLQIFMPGLPKQPLQTTDLAELKDERHFRITGRMDYIIISGGIKYSPEQIEKKLAPFISQRFLISSKPHETLVQQIVLVIEGNENRELKKNLTEICQRELGKFEQPREIIFVPEIPMTIGGKMDRKLTII